MVEVKKIHTYTGHQGAVYTIAPGASPNIFYSSGADGQIIEWDLENLESGTLIAKIPNSVYALKFIPELDTLVIGQNNEGIHLLDVNQKKELGSLKIPNAQIFDLERYKDAILIGTGNGELFEVGLKDLAIRKKAKLSEVSLRSLAIRPDEKEILGGFSDSAFRVIDPNTFDILLTHEAHKSSVFSGIFSPDGNSYLTGSRDAHLKFWNVGEGFVLDQSIVAHMYAINHITFHPGGRYFATASMDKTIKIWDYNQRKLIKVIDKIRHGGHLTSVNKLLWTKHNDYLISCSDDRSLSVWDIRVIQ